MRKLLVRGICSGMRKLLLLLQLAGFSARAENHLGAPTLVADRTVYFMRHGVSLWNRATEMPKQKSWSSAFWRNVGGQTSSSPFLRNVLDGARLSMEAVSGVRRVLGLARRLRWGGSLRERLS